MVKRINYGEQFIDKNDSISLVEASKQKLITIGPKVKLFEKKISRYLKVKHSIVCNSGTSAIHLAYISINLKKNDIIIMPIINFISAFNMAKLFGAKIFLADVDKLTGQMTPKLVQECIKKNNLKNIKAIITMYLGGYPENIIEFFKLKKKLNCLIIEDACHAFGATYKYKNKTFKVGSCKHADISTFSFHPIKPITTGEGGALTTNLNSISSRALLARSHGIIRGKNHWTYDIKQFGMNYRISDINCALGISQIKKINLFLKKRQIINLRYKKLISELGFEDYLKLPEYKNDNKSAHHLFLANVNFKKLKKNKDDLFDVFKKKKIFLQYHYIPINRFSFYKNKNLNSFKNSNVYYQNTISLPIHYNLSYIQQKLVIKTLKKFIDDNKI